MSQGLIKNMKQFEHLNEKLKPQVGVESKPFTEPLPNGFS